jgi:cytochrome c2
MRTVYLKYATVSSIIFITAAIIALAGVRTMVIGEENGDDGAQLFKEKGCSRCHYTDSAEARIGPGLKGLFEMENLPVSGRETTEQTVRNQLLDPYQKMPSYEGDLTEEEMDAIIVYLKTL